MQNPRVPGVSDSLSFFGVTHKVARAKEWYGADIWHGEDAVRQTNRRDEMVVVLSVRDRAER
jgi:hypothetical protein